MVDLDDDSALLSGDELALRRIRRRDAELDAICEDLAAARRALAHWRAAGPAGAAMVAEYRDLLAELRAEALARLRAEGGD